MSAAEEDRFLAEMLLRGIEEGHFLTVPVDVEQRVAKMLRSFLGREAD